MRNREGLRARLRLAVFGQRARDARALEVLLPCSICGQGRLLIYDGGRGGDRLGDVYRRVVSGRVRGLLREPQPPGPPLLARVGDAEEVVHGVRAVVLVVTVSREGRARRRCGVRRSRRGGQRERAVVVRDRHGVSGAGGFRGTREDRHDRHCG